MIAADARCPDGAAVGFPELSCSDATNEADELLTLQSTYSGTVQSWNKGDGAWRTMGMEMLQGRSLS